MNRYITRQLLYVNDFALLIKVECLMQQHVSNISFGITISSIFFLIFKVKRGFYGTIFVFFQFKGNLLGPHL